MTLTDDELDADSQTGDSESFQVAINVCATLTRLLLVKSSSSSHTNKRKAKPKTKKDSKTKEFAIDLDNSDSTYEKLLQSVLTKHGEKKLKATVRRPFPFTYHGPGRPKNSALSIESCDEFRDMVQELRSRASGHDGPPLKVHLHVDYEDVKNALNRAKTDEDEDDNDDELRYGRLAEDGMDDLEKDLARYRGLLEEKYKNEGNLGHTYVGRDGSPLTLTPAMMSEWAIAMRENEATIYVPPNTPAFDPVNRRPTLNAARSAQGPGAAMRMAYGTDRPGNSADVSAVLQFASTAFQGIVELARGRGDIPSAVPRTPPRTPSPRHSRTHSPSPPLPPSPHDLERYLKYAERHLGVQHAEATYLSPMRRKHYGPDILGDLKVSDLTEFPISATHGDAIRLRRGASDWYCNHRKRRRKEEVDEENPFLVRPLPPTEDDEPEAEPEDNRFNYEVVYANGGKHRYWAGPMRPGVPEDEGNLTVGTEYKGGEVTYCNPVTDRWEPVPSGYVAPFPGEDPYDFQT